MSHIDDSILRAIRHRADGGVHVERLLDGARRKGVRRRRIRRTAQATGVAAAVLAVAIAALPLSAAEGPGRPGDGQLGASVPGSPDAGKARPEPSASTDPSPLAGIRPPVATGAKPLTGGGSAGADRLLHLDVTDPDVNGLRWRSGPNWESLSVTRAHSSPNAFNQYEILVGASEAALAEANAAEGEALPGTPTTEELTVNGRPAKLARGGDATRYATLQWQPAAGVWAQLLVIFGDVPAGTAATDRAGVLEIAEWTRFDRVYRCPARFRLAWSPAGTEQVSCALALISRDTGIEAGSGGRFRTTNATFDIEVGRDETAGAANAVRPNVTVSGRAIEAHGGAARHVRDGLMLELTSGTPSIGQDVAARVVAGIEPVTSTDLGTWPNDPLR